MTTKQIFIESPISHIHIPRNPYIVPGLKYKPKQIRDNHEFIIKTVLEYFRFTDIKDIAIKSRKRKFVYPRQVCMYLLCKYSKLTLETIGDMFGGRDHTTVMHAKDAIQDLIDVDPDIRVQVELLTSQIIERSFIVQ